MSQESISSEELGKEIQECLDSHSRLLEYSRSEKSLIIPEIEMQHQYQWKSEEMNILTENVNFYKRMIETIEKAKSAGPVDLPKAPKRKVQDLFKEKLGKKKKQTTMTPLELHQYLSTNIADINTSISRETFSNTFLLSDVSEQNVVEKLKKGLRNLKRQDAQTLLIYINFGNFLNNVKHWMENERKAGRINQSWASWLKEKTGYSDDHARKLRALAKALYGYEQFYFVGLPLSYILRKLGEITIMLQVPEYNEFWKRPVRLLTTNNLQQSLDAATAINPQSDPATETLSTDDVTMQSQ